MHKFFDGLGGTVISATVIDKHTGNVSVTPLVTQLVKDGKRQRKGKRRKEKERERGAGSCRASILSRLRVPHVSCGSSWWSWWPRCYSALKSVLVEMVCTLSKWPPRMVSLVLRLDWPERQHDAHRVTQFPVNTLPFYTGFYALGAHVAVAFMAIFIIYF